MSSGKPLAPTGAAQGRRVGPCGSAAGRDLSFYHMTSILGIIQSVLDCEVAACASRSQVWC